MMSISATEAWERRLRRVLDAVDAQLEDAFGDRFPHRAGRPRRGTTANPKYDGLFSVEAKFTLGAVSGAGPGYIVDVRLATMADVPPEVRGEILDAAEGMLAEALPEAFPGRQMELTRDGSFLRLHGDLALR